MGGKVAALAGSTRIQTQLAEFFYDQSHQSGQDGARVVGTQQSTHIGTHIIYCHQAIW